MFEWAWEICQQAMNCSRKILQKNLITLCTSSSLDYNIWPSFLLFLYGLSCYYDFQLSISDVIRQWFPTLLRLQSTYLKNDLSFNFFGMLKAPGLKSLVLHILVFQDRPDRGRKICSKRVLKSAQKSSNLYRQTQADLFHRMLKSQNSWGITAPWPTRWNIITYHFCIHA